MSVEAEAAAPTESNNEKEAACAEMFEKIVHYVEGELTNTTAQYGLLKELNECATKDYAEMTEYAANVNTEMIGLTEKYEKLRPHFAAVDELSEAVEKLQVAAKELDAYTRRLEAKFKTLDRR